MKHVVLGFVLVGTLLLSFTGGTATAADIGKQAPAFSLKDTHGKEHALKEYLASKYTVVMFIATQCPISNAYNDRMVKLHAEYAGKGIAFVGINSNKQESIEEIQKHAATSGFAFDVLKDWNNVVADAYGAQFTPEIFILDGAGVLVYHGRIDDSKNPSTVKTQDVRETLDALLAGKDVPRPETKAFGCTIKRIKKES
jgi:peroxiredoxin